MPAASTSSTAGYCELINQRTRVVERIGRVNAGSQDAHLRAEARGRRLPQRDRTQHRPLGADAARRVFERIIDEMRTIQKSGWSSGRRPKPPAGRVVAMFVVMQEGATEQADRSGHRPHGGHELYRAPLPPASCTRPGRRGSERRFRHACSSHGRGQGMPSIMSSYKLASRRFRPAGR